MTWWRRASTTHGHRGGDGRVQLLRTPEMVARRSAIADRYDSAFAALLRTLPAHAPENPATPGTSTTCASPRRRRSPGTTSIELMAEQEVGTSVHFIPSTLQPYWRDTYHLEPEDFPVATAEFSTCSLPIFSAMSDEDVDQVIGAVRAILA